MSGCDSIFGHAACWFVKRKIAARRHLYIEGLFVVSATYDDIAKIDGATRLLECFCCMLFKMLFAGDRNGEIEIVNVLSYEERLLIEVLLGIRVDNGNLGPL